LRTVEGKGAEEKSDEEASGIAQEDGRGIEVVAQESEDGARESDGHDFDQRGTMQERNCEDDHRGEQSRSGGQTVETINQAEGVGNRQDPYHRGGETDVPGEDAVAKKYRDVHDAQTAEVKHGGGKLNTSK
jgi:hypothetical protein